MTRNDEESGASSAASLILSKETNGFSAGDSGALSPRSQKQWKGLLQSIEGNSEEDKASKLCWKSSNAPIPAAGLFELPIKVDSTNAELRYEFRTKSYDIAFSISIVDQNGQYSYLLSPERYASNEKEVTGSQRIEGPAMLFLKWDNEYSWLNSKELSYTIELIQSVELSNSEQSRCARAVESIHDRSVALDEGRKTLKDLNGAIDSIESTISDLDDQIERLKKERKRKLDQQNTAVRERVALEHQLDRWNWEIQALSAKCVELDLEEHIPFVVQDPEKLEWLKGIGLQVSQKKSMNQDS